MRDELRVGVQHGDQRNAPKVVALGNHLRADKHVDRARVNGGERVTRGVAALGCVPIDTFYPG